MGIKKRIKVRTKSPKARPMRRIVDHAEVYEEIRQGFRPCDIARKFQISDRMVRYIRANYKPMGSL